MPESPGPTFGYRPALDGLRAVAVGAVVAYHLGYGWARGGFLGVDTFFVLSGYLITSLLLIEFGRSGLIHLRAFWARRARRLLPALFLVLGVVSLWVAFAWPSDQLGTVRGDGLATLFYGANWRFVLTGQSYFALVSLPSPFRHAWSLAIEEQFYLVWPLVVLACLRLGRGRTRILAAVCALGSIASIVLMAALYDPLDPSRAYYGTDTRAHALLIGALLAIVLRRWTAPTGGVQDARTTPKSVRSRVGGAVLAGAGVVAAGICVVAYVSISDKSSMMYRGGFALFALAVAGVIASAVLPGPSPVRRLLALAPLVWVGRISYGVYLWHWPVQLAMTSQRVGVDGVALDLLRVGTTLAIATLSFYAVEIPIRRGVFGRRLRRVLLPVAAGGVATVVLATTAGATRPPAYLQGGGTQGIDQALAQVKASARRSPATSTTTTASTTVPAAPTSAPPVPTVTIPPPHRLLAVGDSLMSSLLPGLRTTARARGLYLQSVAVSGCGVFTGEPLAPDDSHVAWAAGCGSLMVRLQLESVQQYRPDVVLWLSSWETADRIVNGTQYNMDSPAGMQMTLQLIDEAVSRLTSTGARVAFLTIAPTLPTLEYGAPTDEATKRVLLLDQLLEQYAAAHPTTTFVLPLAEQYCPGLSNCPQSINGVDLRISDGRHFSLQGSNWLASWIFDQLSAPRVVPAHP
jgi:peptidoglycan/LPS O-acetylase OafA/YrhL